MNEQAKYKYVLAIGNFDGLHMGHRVLMEELQKQKELHRAQSAVITFRPHPLEVIRGATPPLLMSDQEKAAFLLDYYGVDDVYFLDFSQGLAQMPPADFLRETLLEKYPASHLVVGFNFTYGRGGAGDAAGLERFCQEQQIGLSVIPAVRSPYGIVSSSAIRQKLMAGDIQAANEMLGYWYSLKGVVEQGDKRGQRLGWRTANISPSPDRALPRNGVYAARILWRGELFDGVVNVGRRPTIYDQAGQLLLEAHLFAKGQPDLYGQELQIFFGAFIRPEKRFESLAALSAEIHANSEEAKAILSRFGPKSHLPKALK